MTKRNTKTKPRDRSKENRITRAICLKHETNTALELRAAKIDRSVSWCVEKAVSAWLAEAVQ